MREEGYIKEDSGELKGHLQAQEHRSVMQLMPCVILAAAHNAFDEEGAGLPLVELVFRWLPSLMRAHSAHHVIVRHLAEY